MKFAPFIIALAAGSIILFFIKRKYKKIRPIELIIIFILYCILIALFTEPALNWFRKLVGFIQEQ